MKKFYCFLAGLGVVASAAASQPADTRSQGGETSKPVTLLSPSQGAELMVPETGAEASAKAPRRVTRLPDVPPVKVSLGVLKTHDETWSGSTTDAGYYTVDGNDGTLALQQRVASFSSVVSAVKVGETVYTIQATAEGRFYYQSFNASTWAQRGSREEIDDVNVTQDFAYDSSTNTVYGYFYKESDNNYGYIDFGRYNVSMAEKTSLVEQERDVYTCASDNNGLVYWLSSTQLGWSDPKKKTFSYIYGPQVYPEDHSTMTYDPTSGLLYALVRTEATGRVFKTSLYSIDPVAKSKTLIKDYGKDMGFAGLFVLPPEIAITAPGQATDITVNFDGTDAMLGTVSLTAPSQSRSGAPLTSPLTVIIEVDGTEYAVRDVAPGCAVTSPQYRFAEGAQKIVVTCADATDRGEAVSVDVFAGFDIPAAPQGVVLTEADGHPQLSWQPVTTGANGGSVGRVTYTVTRMPAQQTVAQDLSATTFTDTAYVPDGHAIYYTVTARNSAGTSAAAASNKLAVGAEFTLPFTEGFDTEDDFDLWTVLNANGGSTWTYEASSKSAVYTYDDNHLEGDDWLFSPAFSLQKGKKYKLSYSFRIRQKNYAESFSVHLGKAQTAAAMTRELAAHPGILNTQEETNTLVFSAEEDGTFHLGFYETSDPWKYMLQLDNISLSMLDSNIPAEVSDFTVTPGERGALSATISLKAPERDSDGKPLAALSSITVMRSDRPEAVARFENPTPGAALTAQDTSVTADGTYQYYAYASNEAGDGPETRISAFIGTDVPDAVLNLKLTETADGHPSLTWEAPVTGRNGGWFDASKLTYTVYRYFGEMEAIAEAIAETGAVDSTLPVPTNSQTPVSYAVFPYAGGNAGRAIESNYILIGRPYAAPLRETFPNADMSLSPWMSVTDRPITSAWTLDATGHNPAAADYNGDSGLATFHSAGENIEGVGSWMMSPKISLAGLQHPTVAFALYHSHLDGITTPETMQLFVAAGDGDFQPISPVYQRDNGTTGWAKYTIALQDLPEADWYRFAFKGVTAGGADMYLDDFEIYQGRTVDAAVTELSVPRFVAKGEEMPVGVTVVNYGNTALTGATVAVAGKTLPVPALEAGRKATVSTTVSFASTGTYEVKATVTVADDEVSDNNTRTASVEAVEPKFPAVGAITGNVGDDNRLTIAWTDAAQNGAVTDDFESYKAWSIAGIGDWLMADRDYDNTYYISGQSVPGILDNYPNCSDPKAWLVMDADELGINIWPEGTPHSGNKMLMASASVNYVNADWAISPMLNGRPQTVAFWAKAFTTQGAAPERLRFLWSTGSTVPEDFTPLSQEPYVEVGESWTRYSYSLPEGARRFAIECVSDNAFALFVDDVCYNDMSVPTLALREYRVSRDGTQIAAVTEPQFTEPAPLPVGDYTYTVTAVYDKGAAAPSAPYAFKSTAISDLAASRITITGGQGELTVTGAAGQTLTVTTPAGLTIANRRLTSERETLALAPGLYLVKVAARTQKTIVK